MRSPLTMMVPGILVFLMSGCGDGNDIGPSAPSGEDPVYDRIIQDIDEEIEIGLGEGVYIESEGLGLLFTDVCESRCPHGAVCCWEGEGVAVLGLTGPDGAAATARPVIRPGRDPDVYTWLKDYALGYSFTLRALEPYPSLPEPPGREDYRCTLLIEKIPDASEYGHIVFMKSDPCDLDPDRLEILSASVEGDILKVEVQYSGGCIDHQFTMAARPWFMESLPVRMELYLYHEDGDDPCDAVMTEGLSFNLIRIGELYDAVYGDGEGVMLDIAICCEGLRVEETSVLYRP